MIRSIGIIGSVILRVGQPVKYRGRRIIDADASDICALRLTPISPD